MLAESIKMDVSWAKTFTLFPNPGLTVTCSTSTSNMKPWVDIFNYIYRLVVMTMENLVATVHRARLDRAAGQVALEVTTYITDPEYQPVPLPDFAYPEYLPVPIHHVETQATVTMVDAEVQTEPEDRLPYFRRSDQRVIVRVEAIQPQPQPAGVDWNNLPGADNPMPPPRNEFQMGGRRYIRHGRGRGTLGGRIE